MKYPLYIIALLSCILFLSCDKTKHEDTWWFDNETENLFTNGLFVNYESTCRVITIGCNSDSWIATVNNNDNQNNSWITINKEGMMVLAIVLLKFQRTKDGTKGAHMSNLLMVMTSDS